MAHAGKDAESLPQGRSYVDQQPTANAETLLNGNGAAHERAASSNLENFRPANHEPSSNDSGASDADASYSGTACTQLTNETPPLVKAMTSIGHETNTETKGHLSPHTGSVSAVTGTVREYATNKNAATGQPSNTNPSTKGTGTSDDLETNSEKGEAPHTDRVSVAVEQEAYHNSTIEHLRTSTNQETRNTESASAETNLGEEFSEKAPIKRTESGETTNEHAAPSIDGIAGKEAGTEPSSTQNTAHSVLRSANELEHEAARLAASVAGLARGLQGRIGEVGGCACARIYSGFHLDRTFCVSIFLDVWIYFFYSFYWRRSFFFFHE